MGKGNVSDITPPPPLNAMTEKNRHSYSQIERNPPTA